MVGYNGPGRVYQDAQIAAYTRSESSTSASLQVQPSKAPRTDQSSSTSGEPTEKGDQVRRQIYPVPGSTDHNVKKSTLNVQPSYPTLQNSATRHDQALAYKDGNARRSIDPGINPSNTRRSVDQARPVYSSMPEASMKSGNTFQSSSQAKPWYKGFMRSSSKSSNDRQSSGRIRV